MSPFEIAMLACFGAAWPVSIAKSARSRTNGGKSVAFLVVVAAGYVAGIIHKMSFSLDPVVALYAVNLAMVCTDIVLWLRNARYDRVRRSAECPPA